jgi:hypothetical protein
VVAPAAPVDLPCAQASGNSHGSAGRDVQLVVFAGVFTGVLTGVLAGFLSGVLAFGDRFSFGAVTFSFGDFMVVVGFAIVDDNGFLQLRPTRTSPSGHCAVVVERLTQTPSLLRPLPAGQGACVFTDTGNCGSFNGTQVPFNTMSPAGHVGARMQLQSGPCT